MIKAVTIQTLHYATRLAGISSKFHSFPGPILGKARADEIEALSSQFNTLNTKDFARLLDLRTAPALSGIWKRTEASFFLVQIPKNSAGFRS
ncbi:hypothetical protein KUD11_05415 [Roseovarius sp. LXJ103]|uniref:hypothetical protein n=1 Tax=Roseovarius carneus TaxID=2853164 RepID=UPI000D6120D4|nr:hypothetical protein [Roseovarius carneus]MBZ8118081.1 hypothetical protein [Roseovarius carneus]PWE36178.1 hypothetical protein DD563_09555 [Pelagicola sp. LXJ1103]